MQALRDAQQHQSTGPVKSIDLLISHSGMGQSLQNQLHIGLLELSMHDVFQSRIFIAAVFDV